MFIFKCNECDYSDKLAWNSGKACHINGNFKAGSCGDKNGKFILRRDKRSCYNCKYGAKHRILCELKNNVGKCGSIYIYDNWQPITEDKQMTEYEPTENFTIRNIAEKILDTGCRQAREEFLKYISTLDKNEYLNVDMKQNTSSNMFKYFMKNRERIAWGVNHGHIKEVVTLKPCPFCGSTNLEIRINHVYCFKCGLDGPDKTKWNTRK